MNSNRQLQWCIGSALLVLIVLVGVRFSSGVLSNGPVYDEQYITIPINDIMQNGWSVETAIDYQETKGPAMIWPYAFLGKVFGGTLNDLRFVSICFSFAAMILLIWIAVQSKVFGGALFLVAIGWLLLPYNLVFSEIVMGEVSFLFLSLLAVAAFVWSNASDSPKGNSRLALLLYTIALALALYSRIHAVALAGGVCFTAFAIQGKRSWPWWVASAIAGLLRIPLWIRWDGLVSPEYQALHGLGFRVESLSYLAAALVPFVGIFLIEGWRKATSKTFIAASFIIGVALVFIAMPNLFVPETIDFVNHNDRFQGISASVILKSSTIPFMQQAILAFLAGLGLAGLAGLWHLREKSPLPVQITFWSLLLGWLLYACTRGFVFDRFILTWAFLLPIVWVQTLPRWLLAIQYVFLALIAGYLTVVWL